MDYSIVAHWVYSSLPDARQGRYTSNLWNGDDYAGKGGLNYLGRGQNLEVQRLAPLTPDLTKLKHSLIPPYFPLRHLHSRASTHPGQAEKEHAPEAGRNSPKHAPTPVICSSARTKDHLMVASCFSASKRSKRTQQLVPPWTNTGELSMCCNIYQTV